MSNFLKYMRLFALGITFSSSMALPYVQIKFTTCSAKPPKPATTNSDCS